MKDDLKALISSFTSPVRYWIDVIENGHSGKDVIKDFKKEMLKLQSYFKSLQEENHLAMLRDCYALSLQRYDAIQSIIGFDFKSMPNDIEYIRNKAIPILKKYPIRGK